MSAPKRKRLRLGPQPWSVMTPAEVLARMPADFEDDLAGLAAEITADPAEAAAMEQYATAQAQVERNMRAGVLESFGLRTIECEFAPERLIAWVTAALYQAAQRGLASQTCPHVFYTAVPGFLHVGRGVAACRDCLPLYMGCYEGTKVMDDRCEVCGVRQEKGRFFQSLVPHGGVVVHVDQCESCWDWQRTAGGAS